MWQRPTYWLRRTHLYFGLFLLPWVILYGVTAYLFNHPNAFSDVPVVTLSKSDLSTLPLVNQADATAIADLVVDELNSRASERASDGTTKLLLNKSYQPHYDEAYIFGQSKIEGFQVNYLISREMNSATIRFQPEPIAPKETVAASFSVAGKPEFAAGGRGGRGPRGGRGGMGGGPNQDAGRVQNDKDSAKQPLMLENGLHIAAQQSLDEIVKMTDVQRQFSASSTKLISKDLVNTESSKSVDKSNSIEAKLTSVPDLIFQLNDGTKDWQVRYNALAGSVVATEASEEKANELSWRRFMTRLHTTHGYPDSMSAKYGWAIIVDAMAFIMVFWGISGLIMWLQIKATRKAGFVVLCASGTVAIWLAVTMYMQLN